MKAVLFVVGRVREAAQELPRLRAHLPPGGLRVVVGAGHREELVRLGNLPAEQVLPYSPSSWLLLWMRLLWFLGWSRQVRVLCASNGNSGSLKLLAFALRGRVTFTAPGREALTLRLPRFLWLAFKTVGRRPGEICLVGTAGQERLERILADLRSRYPSAVIHALLPADANGLPADSTALLSARGLLAACRRRPRFATVVIPCTGDRQWGLKLLAWCLPLGYREIYNENYDFCSARDVHVLLRHAWWRLRTAPNRITVLATASPSRLAGIVAQVRRQHPNAPCHGLVPPRLAAAANLFDSATILRAGSPATYLAVLARAFGRRRSGYLVVPCTGEGYGLLKLLFWLLPLGRRELHNEFGDSCRARDFGLLFGHLRWRLTHRLTRRPNRITVLGSASGLYLKTVVADLRRRRPGASIHALLPRSLVAPVSHLFDGYTVLAPVSGRFWRDLLSLTLGGRRSGHLIIPCTNEGYNAIKLLGYWLPLGLREIYNENGDAYLARHLRMMVRHSLWRLSHRIFFQALTERHGRPWALHLAHLLLYPLRLAAGAGLLLSVRLRAAARDRRLKARRPASEQPAVAEDMLAVTNRPFERREPVVSGDP